MRSNLRIIHILAFTIATFLSVSNQNLYEPKTPNEISFTQREPDSFAPGINSFVPIPPQKKVFSKEEILGDSLDQIHKDFKIPKALYPRVSFWFDIYTKYSAQQEVIHHADYPWIIFGVTDVSSILNAPGNKWVKYHRSVKYSKSQVQKVKKILTLLLKRKNYVALSPEEKAIYDQLQNIPRKKGAPLTKKIIAQSLKSIRTQVGQKDFILTGLSESALYLNDIELVFKSKKLPVELTRLPFVESSFNTSAVSRVGASGIWQIMPYLGKRFLFMTNAVDERNSPIKSSQVASFILKQNKQILKSWPLALTAYNHGTGSLLTAIKQTKSRDLSYLIENYNSKSFGFASKNFYSSFLAVLYAEKYKSSVYTDYSAQTPLLFSEIRLTKDLRINSFLKLSGLSQKDLLALNLDIKKEAFQKNMILPRGYVVHLPTSLLSSVPKSKLNHFSTVVKKSNALSL